MDNQINHELAEMIGIAANTQKCKNCEYTKYGPAHSMVCCMNCECEALYNAGYRIQERTAIELLDIIEDTYKEHASDSTSVFLKYLLATLEKKYGGDTCQK